jgi:hypothetical protein
VIFNKVLPFNCHRVNADLCPQKSPHCAGLGYLQRLMTAMRDYTARKGEARHQLLTEVMLIFIISRSC